MEQEGRVVATLLIEDVPSEGGDDNDSDESIVVETVPEGSSPSYREVQIREGTTLRVGRAKTNDVALINKNVSRFHAVFSASASGIVLSDLSSLNGTIVNGSRISTPVDLGSGDIVTIGDTRFAVKLVLGGDTEEGDASHGRTQTAQLAAVVVTVLVVDVCGYTKISEALPPKDVAEMMNEWFQMVSEIVRKHGGEVDKYIGDCVMALWRGSHSNSDALACHSVAAAIEMVEETAVLSESKWMHREKFPWTCRVALNTGEALMGTVGGAGRRDFTVLGDTVNVAFRLEGVAKQKKTTFLLSAATANRVEEQFPVVSLGEVNVAGRTGGVEVFTLAQ